MPLKVFNSKGELKGHYGTDQHWILLLTGFIVARSTLATTHFKGIESLYRWTSPLLPCLLSIFLVIFQKKVCSLRLVRDWIPAMSKKKKKSNLGQRKTSSKPSTFIPLLLQWKNVQTTEWLPYMCPKGKQFAKHSKGWKALIKNIQELHQSKFW